MFIADEIQTGFCRTGDWFACEHEGVEPDLVTTAKGIAGGLPLAGVTGRAELMDAVHVGGLGGTYGGNPVACAAALAAIETMRELDLAARGPADRGGDACRGCARSPTGDPAIGEVRGRGAMLAIELVQPAPGTTRRRRPTRRDRGGRRAPATPPGCSCSPAAPTATCCASCRRWSSPTTTSHRGLDILDDAFDHHRPLDPLIMQLLTPKHRSYPAFLGQEVHDQRGLG